MWQRFLYIDRFAFVRRLEERTATPCSLIAFLAAVVTMCVMCYLQLKLYNDADPQTNYGRMKRSADVRAQVPYFGLLLFREKSSELWYNESFFRWRISYNVIFSGDTNPGMPRQYHDLPITTCKVYFDESLISEINPWEVNWAGGKQATCVDRNVAQNHLRQKIAAGEKNKSQVLTSDLMLQGRYGEPEYWYVNAALMPCSYFQRRRRIDPIDLGKCATLEEEQLFWQTNLRVDMVMLDNLQPGFWEWSNLYTSLRPNLSSTFEVYMQPIHRKDTSRNFPSILQATETTHLRHARNQERLTTSRRRSTVVSFNFRLDSNIDVETVSYYSLETFARILGATGTFLFVILMAMCKSWNYAAEQFELWWNRTSRSEPEAPSNLNFVYHPKPRNSFWFDKAVLKLTSSTLPKGYSDVEESVSHEHQLSSGITDKSSEAENSQFSTFVHAEVSSIRSLAGEHSPPSLSNCVANNETGIVSREIESL